MSQTARKALRPCVLWWTAGFTKFVIHRIEVMDSTGCLDAAPGIGPGVLHSLTKNLNALQQQCLCSRPLCFIK